MLTIEPGAPTGTEAWNVSNAERQQDKFENIWVEKPQDPKKRIDGLVASIIALSRLMVLGPPEPPPYTPTQGIRVIRW